MQSITIVIAINYSLSSDKKIDRAKRETVPVLAIGSEVIWAVGVRFSEGFKVDSSTKRVMILKITDIPEDGK